MRKTFTMSRAQHAKLLEAMQPVPAMWIGGPPRSVQQNANDAWISLGQEMGFNGATVCSIPGGSEYEFSAEESPVTRAPQKSAADAEYESWISALRASACATCGGFGFVSTVEYADSMNPYQAGMPCPDCTTNEGTKEEQRG